VSIIQCLNTAADRHGIRNLVCRISDCLLASHLVIAVNLDYTAPKQGKHIYRESKSNAPFFFDYSTQLIKVSMQSLSMGSQVAPASI